MMDDPRAQGVPDGDAAGFPQVRGEDLELPAIIVRHLESEGREPAARSRGPIFREAFAVVLAIASIGMNLASWEGEPLLLVRLQGIVVALVLLTMAISEYADRRRASREASRPMPSMADPTR